MNVLIKKVNHLPAMEIVFFRCFVSAVLCFGIIFQINADWRGSNRTLLLARGIFGTIAVYTKMGYFSNSGKPSNSLHCLGYSPLENIWN